MDIKAYLSIPPWEWPRNAPQQFLKLLKDRQAKPAERLIAAQLAGNTVAINDQLADALLAVADNQAEAEDLRVRAVIALGPVLELGDTMEFEDPDDVPISEDMYHNIRKVLEKIYRDTSNSKLVRRRTLEAAVRAQTDWQQEAIRKAYASGDREWILTAVFAMRYVQGEFEAQILESLKSTDKRLHCEAVLAAGTAGVTAAWPHIVELLRNPTTSKDLLLAAIESVSEINPAEAEDVLSPLLDSHDEDISEAASEAIAMANGIAGMDEFDEEDDEEDEDDAGGQWVN